MQSNACTCHVHVLFFIRTVRVNGMRQLSSSFKIVSKTLIYCEAWNSFDLSFSFVHFRFPTFSALFAFAHPVDNFFIVTSKCAR